MENAQIQLAAANGCINILQLTMVFLIMPVHIIMQFMIMVSSTLYGVNA